MCSFNRMVDCMDGNCNTCGWNPKVASERIKEWNRERNNKKSEKVFYEDLRMEQQEQM